MDHEWLRKFAKAMHDNEECEMKVDTKRLEAFLSVGV